MGPIRTLLLASASVARTSLSLGATGESAGAVGGTCDIEYSPSSLILIGDQDRFAPLATYNASTSGWVAPAAMWQWISRDSEPWQSMGGGGTPTNSPSSSPVSRFDLEDTLEFHLGVSLPLQSGATYRINVAYTSTSDSPTQNPQAVLCRTAIAIRYFDAMPEYEMDAPNYLSRSVPAVVALPDTL